MCKERPKKSCRVVYGQTEEVWEAGLAAPERFKARSGRGLVCRTQEPGFYPECKANPKPTEGPEVGM